MSRRKFWRRISGVLFFIGMLIAFGTAGSSDLEIIDEGREALQLVLALVLILASAPGIIGGMYSND